MCDAVANNKPFMVISRNHEDKPQNPVEQTDAYLFHENAVAKVEDQDTALSARNILISWQQKRFLKEQLEFAIPEATTIQIPQQETYTTLDAGLELCTTLKNHYRYFSCQCFIRYISNKSYNKDTFQEKLDVISPIILSGKTNLTTKEECIIQEFSVYFLEILSKDFITFLKIIKNIFEANQPQRDTNDFKLISWVIDWNHQFQNKRISQISSCQPCFIYLLSTVMLTVLDINPHIIFDFNYLQIKGLETANIELYDNFLKNILPIIANGNDLCFQYSANFIELMMYELWVDLFVNEIDQVKNFLLNQQFIELFSRYLVSFIHDKKTIEAIEEKVSSVNPLFLDDKPLNDFKKTLFIGDEFEFFCLDQQQITQAQYRRISSAWLNKLESIVKEKNIHKNEFSIESSKHLGNTRYKITIGQWSYCIFLDSDILEVTSQPYHLQDKFRITENGEDKYYTVSELYNDFVFSIVQSKEINMIGITCHKHIDTRALNGDTEMLFRILMFMQNCSWFPKLLKRENRIKNYEYVSQEQCSDDFMQFKQQVIKKSIEDINENLQSGEYSSKIGNYSDIVRIAKMLYELDYFPIASKYTPCALHHIDDTAESQPDLMKVPTSTMELRFFNGLRTGEESTTINKLIILIFEFLRENQANKKLIEYTGKDPLAYTAEEAICEFEKLLTQLDIAEDDKPEYRALIRCSEDSVNKSVS